MKNIKPHIIVFYTLGILFLLSLLLFSFPENGITLGKLHLKYTNITNLSKEHIVEKKDIKEIIKEVDTTMNVVNIDSLAIKKADSIATQKKADSIAKKTEKPIAKKNVRVGIKLNKKAKEYLYVFFKKLANAKRKKISVLHYGDSQIESDRITSYLRQKMQLQFGGYGPGLIPATDVYNTYSFEQEYSSNFKRYTAFSRKKLKSKKYGAMASASRFTKEFDTLNKDFHLDSLKDVTAWISVGSSRKSYSHNRVFTRVKMHYNDCIAPVKLKIYENENLLKEVDLITDGKQHNVALSFTKTPGKLKYEFTGKISPNICAFSLEGETGVQVSNIGMRGTDGTVFKRTKFSTLSGMMHEVNTQLILMQFGGNSVVAFKDSIQVKNYANWFKQQIKTVQKAMPGSMVIVIGPSDMSKLINDNYETYPYLPYCVDEMKRVAIESNAGFWNLYKAMGGKNSMPSWVEKRLAANDYVHFSNKGAKFAGQLFWNAFINEYVKWKSLQKNE